jgi:purine-nucleoside/S-methyl-5'-thioadenosine phosphorylase / adenosine deaminase
MTSAYATCQVLSDDRVVHGFFGRRGGWSDGDLASNNMSLAVGDLPHTVQRNRIGAVGTLGRQLPQLILLKQVHSTRVETITGPNRTDTPIEADAMVTNRRDVLLGILTADCAPVLLVDPQASVVGAAHAGWKGAAGGILGNTVAAMVALGAIPANIRAAIGPTISGPNYEIGPETAAQITGLNPAAKTHIAIPAGEAREHFDIPGLLMEQLFAADVGLVGDLALCTYAHPDLYFSHRYATHKGITTGRQISLIGLA